MSKMLKSAKEIQDLIEELDDEESKDDTEEEE